MTVETYASFDLSDERVCRFLLSGDKKLTLHSDQIAFLEEDGIVISEADAGLTLSEEEEVIDLFYHKKTTLTAIDDNNGRPRGDFDVFDVFKASCKLSLKASVFFSHDADNLTREVIYDTFSRIDIEELKDKGISYVNKLIVDSDSVGINHDSYFVVISTLLERMGEDEVSFETRSLLSEHLPNHAYINPKESMHCGVPDLGFSGDEIEVDNLEDAIVEIERMIYIDAESVDCADLQYRNHRVGTLFQYPEIKVEWVKKKIKVGKCRVATIKIPKTFRRTRKNILIASTVIPRSLVDAMEKGTIECLIFAGVSTGVLAIITGGVALPAAAKAFVSAFTECMRQKFGDIVRCIVPRLDIAVEKGGWRSL